MSIRIRPYLFLALALVSAIPIVFFGIWPHSKALDHEVAEVSERHLLIAQNIRHALQRYDRDVRALFRFLTAEAIAGSETADTEEILENFHFRHICVASMDDPTVIFNALTDRAPCPIRIPAERYALFKQYAEPGEVTYTPVQEAPDGTPVLYLVLQVDDYLSIGAINTDYFVELGKAVSFGKSGHAAIVDHTGQVLAHPLPDWIQSRKNISKVAPVQLMIAGETGVSQFYSPATKMDMIAGYTAVPGPGWGVMIPQPMAELEAKADDVKTFALGVILLGLAVAAIAAWWLAGVTARPLSAVAEAAQAMTQGSRGIRVDDPRGFKPREVSELASSFNEMADAVDSAMTAEREAHADFRAIIGASPAATFLLDRKRRFRLVNQRFETWFGRTGSEVTGHTPDQVLAPALAELLGGAAESVQESGEPVDLEFRAPLSDGDHKEITAHVFPIKQSDGKPKGVGAILVDTTVQKIAEERLRQGQKMEAVGQLTGGVAHDFNNLLAIIQGNANFLLEENPDDDDMLPAILRATQRGADLTQRLLAFSRLQPLRPQPIDMAELVDEMSVLLSRSLGETIEIVTASDPGLWPASADQSQVESALLNLAINARDAMPGGGKLTIECANAQLDKAYVARNPEALEGDYVMLAVSDDGIGMTPEVLAHAFEPFFTTKEVGEGSGLGLSMVYGFVKQSKGHVVIYSEVGEGTTVRIYLPRDTTVVRHVEKEEPASVPRGHGELILVIEDDAELRGLAVKMLEALDYRVIGVPAGKSALAMLEREDGVDLVLSDVILPGGMSGPAFSEQAKKLYPDLEVIFMSGYPAEAAARTGILDPDQVLLNKPFQRHQLAKAVRDALDRRSESQLVGGLAH